MSKIKLNEFLVKKQMANAYFDNNISLSNEYNKINFTKIFSTTDKLTIENGKIKIGKGVTKILVSASSFLEAMGAESVNYIWWFINKNNSRTASSICSGVSVSFQTSIISDYILEVTEGDLLQLEYNAVYKKSGSVVSVRGGQTNTRLHIEIIE